jgi:outer membrane immunogenic protein
MFNKSSLAAGAALLLFGLSAPAFAADMPLKAAPAVPVAGCNWCGFYMGVHAGYGWSEVDASIGGIDITPTPQPKGGFGGWQFGYNWMVSPNWLLGIETDLSIGNVSNTVSLFSIPGTLSFDARSTLEYFGTVRARVGYATGNWLFYGTGGLAAGRNEVNASLNIPGFLSLPFVEQHKSHWGWTAGGGIEYMVMPHWSVKAEYLYADLGARDYGTIINTAFVPPVHHDQTLQVVKIGLNYVAGSGGASALPGMPTKAPVMAACAWCGFYAGVHGGYGWSDIDSSIGGLPISPNPKPKGGFGGVQAGYNWMMSPNWLVGLESDVSLGSITDTATLFSFGPFALDAQSNLEYFGTARARVGFVQNSWLFYGTGGLAWGRNHLLSRLNLAGFVNLPIVDDHEYHVGWTAGGGVEWMLAQHWTAKIEYLYADLGFKDYPTIISTTLVPPVHRDQTLQTVKLGVNYKL